VVCSKGGLRLVKIKKLGRAKFKVFEEVKDRISFEGKAVKCAVDLDGRQLLVAVNGFDHLKVIDTQQMQEVEQIANSGSTSTNYLSLVSVTVNGEKQIILRDRANISLVLVDTKEGEPKRIVPFIKSKYDTEMLRDFNLHINVLQEERVMQIFALEYSARNSCI
jgi:hypothetical protein